MLIEGEYRFFIHSLKNNHNIINHNITMRKQFLLMFHMLYDLSGLLMNTQENCLQHGQTKFNGSFKKIPLWWCLILWYICTKFWENNEFKKSISEKNANKK